MPSLPPAGAGRADCPHPDRLEGVCVVCGHCVHELILNAACFYCGETALDPLVHTKKPIDPPLISAARLGRGKKRDDER